MCTAYLTSLLYLVSIFRLQLLYRAYCNLVYAKDNSIPSVCQSVDFQGNPCPAVL